MLPDDHSSASVTTSSMSNSTPAEPDLRFPVGRLTPTPAMNAAERSAAIDAIAAAPTWLREAVDGLSEEQLDSRYRPEGWTVRQVVHHVADSHINAYIRFRFGLTESQPTVKPYEEAAWAELEDARTLPVEVSLDLLDALHERLVTLLRSLHERDFARTIDHPDNGIMTMDALVGMYAWHGRHHTAHITALRERMQWS